jgi:hypothetical protein
MDNKFQNGALLLCGMMVDIYTKSENNRTKNEKDKPEILKEHKISNT